MIDFDTFTKIAKSVGDLGKLIVAEGFKKLPRISNLPRQACQPNKQPIYLDVYALKPAQNKVILKIIL